MCWKIIANKVAPGYPRLISETWPGLPGDINAAFTYQDGRTYFFKGSQFWRFAGKNLNKGYPRQISDGFPGIPDNVDAAIIWNRNKNIYFFKGKTFLKYKFPFNDT